MSDYICDFAGCENTIVPSERTLVGTEDGYALHVCDECADKVDDSSGYCSIYCMCGHGCTGEC